MQQAIHQELCSMFVAPFHSYLSFRIRDDPVGLIALCQVHGRCNADCRCWCHLDGMLLLLLLLDSVRGCDQLSLGHSASGWWGQEGNNLC